MSLSGHQNLQPNSGAVKNTTILHSVLKQLPSSQEKRGDRKLERTFEIAHEFEFVISEGDWKIIGERIAFARDMKVGLDQKWGISKFLHAREYRRAARDAYRYAKGASSRGLGDANHSQADIIDGLIRVVRALYRCHLSCEDAFPSPSQKAEWVAAVWSDACERTAYPSRLVPQGEELVGTSVDLLADMKTKIRHPVESLYGFDTSQDPDSIIHNARRAQALLTNMNFIYRDTGETPRHPYRHPIIQKAINLIWFLDKDGDGIVFHEYFKPIPIQAVALVLTAIECCIDEWIEGTQRVSDWNEGRYKSVYHSHIKSLADLRDRDHGDLLEQIQRDLLENARAHAGAPPDSVTGSGRLPPGALDAAIHEDLIPTINVSSV